MTMKQHMLRDIEHEVRYTRDCIGKDALGPHVLQGLVSVPRHEFVPEELRVLAYHNGPLSIGYGQTISQPYMVALMTDLLEPEPDDVILEIGTGCGYQSAVLAQLVEQVYSIEILPQLAVQAAERLQRLGYHNVEVRQGDGAQGWMEHAPYDGIIVTAAAPWIPLALVEQLKPGARLVIPVGPPHLSQELTLIEKRLDGSLSTRRILAVAFVPLTGNYGAAAK